MLEVAAAQPGFLQPLQWNLVLFMFSVGKMLMCNMFGMWGLFWYNDDGEMMEACLTTGIVGARAEYETAS